MRGRFAIALALVASCALWNGAERVAADDTGGPTTTAPAIEDIVPAALEDQSDPTVPTVPELVGDTPGVATTSGPEVTVSPAEVPPNGSARIGVTGFPPGPLTVSVCGNEARRGSADCNMTQSQGMLSFPGELSDLTMIISEPPTTCPCLIRVSSTANQDVAVAPIVITGHPIGPLIDPPSFGDLVGVQIEATEAPKSFWGYFRPNLGGPTPYYVSVTVKNLTTTTLHHLKVFAAVGHHDTDNLAVLTFGDPGALAAGQTWKQTIKAVVRAPAIGTLKWRTSVTGAGQTVTANSTTEHRPILLTIAALLVTLLIGVLIMRALVRRHIRRAERAEAPPSEIIIDAHSVDADEHELELVSR